MIYEYTIFLENKIDRTRKKILAFIILLLVAFSRSGEICKNCDLRINGIALPRRSAAFFGKNPIRRRYFPAKYQRVRKKFSARENCLVIKEIRDVRDRCCNCEFLFFRRGASDHVHDKLARV